jgi:hypothetical protein
MAYRSKGVGGGFAFLFPGTLSMAELSSAARVSSPATELVFSEYSEGGSKVTRDVARFLLAVSPLVVTWVMVDLKLGMVLILCEVAARTFEDLLRSLDVPTDAFVPGLRWIETVSILSLISFTSSSQTSILPSLLRS